MEMVENAITREYFSIGEVGIYPPLPIKPFYCQPHFHIPIEANFDCFYYGKEKTGRELHHHNSTLSNKDQSSRLLNRYE
jgi:hypothetical protein